MEDNFGKCLVRFCPIFPVTKSLDKKMNTVPFFSTKKELKIAPTFLVLKMKQYNTKILLKIYAFFESVSPFNRCNK